MTMPKENPSYYETYLRVKGAMSTHEHNVMNGDRQLIDRVAESAAEGIVDRVIAETAKTTLNVSWYIPDGPGGVRAEGPVWPNNWPVPRLGDSVVLKDGRSLIVSAIDWFPEGEDGGEPMVYIVLKSYSIGGFRP
jgi:hypothetical protein